MRSCTGLLVLAVVIGCGAGGGSDRGPSFAPDDASIVDGSPVDAELVDGGPVDASVDASVDARLTDARLADAAPVDAGSVDARPIDAGTIDAAPIDGGVQNPDLVAACGAMPVSFDDWENCYRKRKCEWEVNCVSQNTYLNVQECIAQGDAVSGGRLGAERRERKRAVDQGRASINVDRFAQCLVETSGAHCNTSLFLPACLTRFDGTRDDGATCLTDVECASPDAVCTSTCSDACCLGTCQPKFKLGQTCTDRHSCEPGQQCNIRRFCISGDINTACMDDSDCDSNAWCDQLAHLCKADFALGADCTNPLQCGGEASCVGVTVSSTDPGSCLRISEVGDTCDAFCYGNLYCDPSGHCKSLPGLGEVCPALTNCAGVNTVCSSSGTCVLRGDVGAPCSNTQKCLAGLFCTSALSDPSPKCAAPRDNGQACRAPSHCQSYLCSGTMMSPGVCLGWSDTCPPSN